MARRDPSWSTCTPPAWIGMMQLSLVCRATQFCASPQRRICDRVVEANLIQLRWPCDVGKLGEECIRASERIERGVEIPNRNSP